MAKRRKRTKAKDLDDDDFETEKYDKKGKGRKRSSRSKDTSDINKRKEALIVFGIAGILIAAVLGGYYAYAYILYPEEESSDIETPVTYGVKLEVINQDSHNFGTTSNHIAHMGELTQYLLLVSNTGTGTDKINIQFSDPPVGWVVELEVVDLSGSNKRDSDNNIRIIAKGSEVLRMTVLVPEQEGNSITTQVTASSTGDTSKESTIECRTQIFDLGDGTSKSGDKVKVHYTLVDRGTDAEFNKNVWKFNQEGEYPPPGNEFIIGTGVIPGFSELAENMRKDQTKVWKIPVEKCYGIDETDTKPDGALMYEMVMLDLDAE